MPKSSVEIIRGGKSREKTLSISGLEIDVGEGETKALERLRESLERSALGDDRSGKKR